MRGLIGLTTKEKEDILKKHSQVYDGYATRNQSTNMYPITVYNDARDSQGITLDNNYNPTIYKNHKINEIAAKNLHYDEIEPAYEFDSSGPGDPNLGYDVYNDTRPAYDFDSSGPGDPNLGYDVYNDTRPAYDFDSQGPADPFYGGGYQPGTQKLGDKKDKEFNFDTKDFDEYIEDMSSEEDDIDRIKKLMKK